ncbi:hypothetical protein HX802_01235 [Marine Group I thaumarchaeote]|uniref:Uncharacterized protein n=1 Tax=Marine Group I thaumarchaeote TaxID=2511932 RepID=A0A7K4NDQ4_9ARCH|nr:hypothetical protein [Marine Group I thaumarchaeote]
MEPVSTVRKLKLVVLFLQVLVVEVVLSLQVLVVVVVVLLPQQVLVVLWKDFLIFSLNPEFLI